MIVRLVKSDTPQDMLIPQSPRAKQSCCQSARNQCVRVLGVLMVSIVVLPPLAAQFFSQNLVCVANSTLELEASGYDSPMEAKIPGDVDFTQLAIPKGMQWRNGGDSFKRCAPGLFNRSDHTIYQSTHAHQGDDFSGGILFFAPDTFDPEGVKNWRQAVDAVTNHPGSCEAHVTLGCKSGLKACGGHG